MQNSTTVRPGRPKRGTIVDRAAANVTGFKDLQVRLEKNLVINGRSESTYGNYVRHLAHIALHFNENPLRLSSEQVTDYLFLKKKSEDVSKTFFILTVHSLRAACRVYDLPYEQFKLPKLPTEKKLPVVLNVAEAKALLTAASHSNKVYALVIALMLDCGLRISEVPALEIGDIDLERSRLHVRCSKRQKDRSIPIGKGVLSRLKTHLDYWNPTKFVFECLTSSGNPISIASINHVLKESVKIAGITKRVSAHTLRHSYATLLVENQVPLPVVQEFMGHSDIKTTMIYLKLVSLPIEKIVTPVDQLFNVR